MIGIILLICSLILFIRRMYRQSFFLYISFCYSGLRVLTDTIIGVKNIDLALIYLLFVLFFNIRVFNNNSIIAKAIKCFIGIAICCCIFSFVHYDFSIYQILQGGRPILLVLSFFMIRKYLIWEDVKWIINKLYLITIFTGILYILQFVGINLLPYGDVEKDLGTGAYRFYNEPTFLVPFIFICGFSKDLIQSKHKNKALILLFIDLFLTQSRTYTALTIVFFSIGLLKKRGFGKTIRYAVVLGVIALPFVGFLSSRISGGDTSGDIGNVISGGFVEDTKNGTYGNGTLSYRLSLLFERVFYLQNRPLSENMLGLGIISESQEKTISKHYQFVFGLPNESGCRQQLASPDISYANMLCRFGYFGGCIFLFVWFSIMIYLYKKRDSSDFSYAMSVYIAFCFFASFTGGYMEFNTLTLPYLATITNNDNDSISC